MKDALTHAVRLQDYQPLAWRMEHLELTFALDPARTQVHARLVLHRVPAAATATAAPLRLHGRDLELLRLTINGHEVPPAQYPLDAEGLLLHDLPERAEIGIDTAITPETNTTLEGLYVSGGSLCTQCEPEGFRRITFFPDRPDLLTRYRVRLEADAQRYPVLLANGNRRETGLLPGGRHYAVWEDPFPKPCYLFALVAGDLVCIQDTFVTRSGRTVALEIYVEAHNRARCAHAVQSLQKAMRYDEEAFGREYDLDVYMIVAVDDFNMGAMENKGLNLFNAKYVLADPDMATDDDYVQIESVIAHEYFHNWSGNRVTCRDWFQLSLKEGLTVFRDQEFTTDCTLFGVKRIDDVQRLRAFQFAEDAGPLAHPVRPERYQEINNFYTVTIYEKGAELIRMLRTLLGTAVFRAGLDAYFARFDGQAVTIEDFVQVLAEVSGRDLQPFLRWYTQAGTPHVRVRSQYHPAAQTLQLCIEQHTPPTPGQPRKEPLWIPLRLALLNAQGEHLTGNPHILSWVADAVRPDAVSGTLPGVDASADCTAEATVLPPPVPTGTYESVTEWVLECTEARQQFLLQGIRAAPAALSWLRGFSAPVLLHTEQSREQLAHLLAQDDDPFARWDAGQQLWKQAILARMQGEAVDVAILEELLTHAMAALLEDATLEPVFLATLLTVPAHRELAETAPQMDPVALDTARRAAEAAVFRPLADRLSRREPALAGLEDAGFTAPAMGQRRLRNRILTLRVACSTGAAQELAIAAAVTQYHAAQGQTLRMGALLALNDQDVSQRETLLAAFEQRFHQDPLVLDKWFALQASSSVGDGCARLETLYAHPQFRWSNPNRVRAVLAPFMAQNHRHFHQVSGEGYQHIIARLEALDRLNPQTAAKLVQPFARWRRLDPQRAAAMHTALTTLAARSDLSRDLRDVLARMLAD